MERELQVLYRVLVRASPNQVIRDMTADEILFSLEKEAPHRASPWRMLEHPWMVEMRAKRVNMAHFLATVWGWEEGPTK